MDITNTIAKYFVKQTDVSYAEEISLAVEISENPVFDNRKSIDVKFSGRNPECELGNSTMSYKSINAEIYSGRMNVDIILPNGLSVYNQAKFFESSRAVIKKILPQLIAEHEKRTSK